MTYTIVIRPEAERDIQSAFAWYEEKRLGLGHDFYCKWTRVFNSYNETPKSIPLNTKE